jgi:predicted nucleotidyltransferase
MQRPSQVRVVAQLQTILVVEKRYMCWRMDSCPAPVLLLLYNKDMAVHVPDVSPKSLDQYRRTAIRRQKARASKVKPRMDKGWKLARKAARILREQYHAERVAVFGSLLHEARFTPWSDVDIAAWGIPPEQTFRAIGAVMDLDASLEINLVDVNTCTPSLRKAIEQEAVDV